MILNIDFPTVKNANGEVIGSVESMDVSSVPTATREYHGQTVTYVTGIATANMVLRVDPMVIAQLYAERSIVGSTPILVIPDTDERPLVI